MTFDHSFRSREKRTGKLLVGNLNYSKNYLHGEGNRGRPDW